MQGAIDRARVRQIPKSGATSPAPDPGSASQSAARPVLNLRGVAVLLGISERRVHELRAEGLLPEPLQLGPRSLRWFRDEVLDHLSRKAPRGGGELPPQLRTPDVIAKRNASNALRSGAAGSAGGAA